MSHMHGASLEAGVLVEATPPHPDPERHGHSVSELAADVAVELGLDEDARRETTLAGLLHDIGKSEIPIEIVTKPGPLTAAEEEVMKTHTVRGQEILQRADPSLRPIADIVRACHERVDGRGYPDGLVGDEIPLAARIVLCCDAYDAMTTDRPYRQALGHERAVAELVAGVDTQFDRRIVLALLRVLATRGYAEPSLARIQPRRFSAT